MQTDSPIEFLQISAIDTNDRQRKFFDEGKIIDLAENIKDLELLHAPVVLQESNKLVAGERRLRAMEMLHRKGQSFTYQGQLVPPSMTPVSRASSTDPVAIKELELSENLLRENLSWQERVQAERELHQLRKSQNVKQTVTKTAKEIKGVDPTPTDISRLNEDLFLAENLEDPEVARVKNRKDALRIAKEKALTKKRKEFAETFKADPTYVSPHILQEGKMEDHMPRLKAPFDLLITDPPYGMDAFSFGSQFRIAHAYEDASEGWQEMMISLASLSYKHAKEKAHAFVFCHILKWPVLAEIFSIAGWDVWPRPLIWDKGSLGSLPKPHHGPRFCYEAILFASKGNKEVLRTGRDIISFPTASKTFHAAEKPVELYVELISRTCEAGALIIDPFCGSGTVFPAASRMAVKAIGIEADPDHYNTALERMTKEA